VVGLSLFDLRRRGKVGDLSMVGVSGKKRRRRSKRLSPTTPTFLSEPDAPPPTKPVVYSPVPKEQASKQETNHEIR
jgi:hypothetical protein